MKLDPQQQAAVETDSDNALVIAGAGSGKTRVLTERVAYLIETQKVSPFEILSFSFTRKASNEIRDRLEARIGGAAHKCHLGTMHSIALQMLRKFGEIIGLKPDKITIYSEWESSFLLREVAAEIGVFKKTWMIPKKEIDAAFSAYYERGEEPTVESKIYPLFAAFIQRCTENNALAYGALLIGLEMLIPTMARFMRIRHVLVDEVQDIDPLQWRIINKMREACGAAVFVVGDIRQSVYSFRGAVPEYILEHQDDFDIYELQNNYRSVPSIVTAANRLMEHSKEFLGGGMNSVREDGSSLVIIPTNMDSALTADFLTINRSSEETAVLARNHALLKKLSFELEQRGVDHTYIGKKSALTNSDEFRRFHAFLKLIENPYDNFSFLLIREFLGLSSQRYADIRVDAAMHGKSHFQIWIDGPCQSGLHDFMNAAIAYNFGLEAMAIGLDELLLEIYKVEAFDFKPTVDFILDYMMGLPVSRHSIKQYLDWLTTYDIQDEIAEAAEGVTLCTIHAAKGLEWPTVIVAGCNEGIIPSRQAITSGDIEEERRLFYVALTRARDQCVLAVRPEVKEIDGRIHESPLSRFVSEAIG